MNGSGMYSGVNNIGMNNSMNNVGMHNNNVMSSSGSWVNNAALTQV